MAAKGTQAKEKVIEQLKTAFGQKWIGEYDKKYYIWSEENGEKIQIAITLTCPKNPVGVVDAAPASNVLDFESMGDTIVAPTAFEPAQVSDEERANIAELMAKLGL